MARWLSRAEFWLFAATGLAVPFFAFPVVRMARRGIDVATILALLFVAAVALRRLLLGQALSRRESLTLLAAVIVPLLVLLPPRPEPFFPRTFVLTFLHWTLLVLFFLGSSRLELDAVDGRRLLVLNVAVGTLVALFALYQVVGIPQGWPATGDRLFAFQRGRFRLAPIEGAFPGGQYWRPTSIFLEPAWMGGYVTAILSLCLGLLCLPRRGRGSTVAVAAATTVILAAIVASISWGAYLDLFAVLGVAAVTMGGLGVRRGAAWAVSLGAAVVAGFLLFSAPGRTVSEALLARWRLLMATPVTGPGSPTASQDSSWLRFQNAVNTARHWREHPVGGLGLGQLDLYKRGEHATPRDVVESGRLCGWLSIGAEMGSLGPALLAAPVLFVFARWRRRRGSSLAAAVPALAALAVVEQLHTASFVDLWWWFPLALAAALAGCSDVAERAQPLQVARVVPGLVDRVDS